MSSNTVWTVYTVRTVRDVGDVQTAVDVFTFETADALSAFYKVYTV